MSPSDEKTIRDFYPLSEDLQRLIRAANYDLYQGPLDQETADSLDLLPWPGFTRACEQIANQLELNDLWFNAECGFVTDNEPSWCEDLGDDSDSELLENPEDWTLIDRSDVLRILVGRELAPYVR